jgi:hypothetical protein
MKNTVRFGENFAKLPEILFAHSSRNRHFETASTLNYVGHRSILAKSPIISIKYTDIPGKCSFCDIVKTENWQFKAPSGYARRCNNNLGTLNKNLILSGRILVLFCNIPLHISTKFLLRLGEIIA